MKLMFSIVLILVVACGCSNRDLESAVYQQRRGRMQCYCGCLGRDYHVIDIINVSSCSTGIKNVWKVTIKGRCEKVGEVTEEKEYLYIDGKARFIKDVGLNQEEERFRADLQKGNRDSFVSFPTDSDSVVVNLKRGDDAWVLKDAQANLQAAGGPTNEVAIVDFDKRVKPIRDREFRRLYGEMTGTDEHAFDFENNILRQRPDHEKAAEMKERHTEAARRFKALTPDQWLSTHWTPEGR